MMNKTEPSYGIPENLEIGTRFPNFRLAGDDGGFVEYHRDITEKPTLVFAARADDLGAEDVSSAAAVIGDKVNVVSITPGVVSPRPDHVRSLLDPEGILIRSVGLPESASIVAMLMDANQRIVSIYDGAGGIEAWLSRNSKDLIFGDPVQMTDFAPVISIPRVLDPEFCRSLIDIWLNDHDEGKVSAAVDGRPAGLLNFDMKRRLDHIIERPSPLYSEISKKIGAVISPELFKAFQFEKARTEAFYIARYNDDRRDFFAAHRDNNSPSTSKRKFAISIELNDDYEGGGLRFPEFANHHYRARAGGAIVFSCSLMHEALPVTRGNRFVLLAFLSDPSQ